MSRAAGKGRWLSTAATYLLACTLAAALLGALLSGLGLPVAAILGPWKGAGVAAAIACAYGCAELGLLPLPRPQRHVQVPGAWRRRFPPEVAAALYGGILGLAVLTTIPFASVYVLLAWTFLSGNVLSGALTFGVFGLARATPAALLSPVAGRGNTASRLVQALTPWHVPLVRLTGWGLIGLAALLVVQAWR